MKSRSQPAKGSPYRPLPVNTYAGLTARDRQEQRRRRLLDAATALFGAHGYSSTTIQAICDEAGCALRTFYEEFGSREALLIVVYERIAGGLLDATFAAAEAAGSAPLDVVEAGVRAYVSAITSDMGRARIMLIEALGVSADVDSVRRRAQASFVERIGATTQRMSLGFGADDAEMTSLALIGAADHLATAWVISRGRIDAERMARTLVMIWTRTLRIA